MTTDSLIADFVADRSALELFLIYFRKRSITIEQLHRALSMIEVPKSILTTPQRQLTFVSLKEISSQLLHPDSASNNNLFTESFLQQSQEIQSLQRLALFGIRYCHIHMSEHTIDFQTACGWQFENQQYTYQKPPPTNRTTALYNSTNNSIILSSIIPDIDPIPLLTDPPLRKTSTKLTPPTLPKDSPNPRSLPRTDTTSNQFQKQHTNLANHPATRFAPPLWSTTITMGRSPALIPVST
jgi:hypothetical protein